MPDYKSILRRSIEGVPDHTADMRRAIYERARATISRQLTSVEPPLPPESIEVQHQMLEQAIAEMEGEYALAEIDPAEFEAEIGLHSPADAGSSEYEDEPAPEQAPAEEHSEAFIDYGMPGGGAYAAPQQPIDIRPSRAPMMIVLSLLVLAGIGAAVLGYRYQEPIMALVNEFSGSSEDVAAVEGSDAGDAIVAEGAPDETIDGDADETAIAKSEERLGEVTPAGNVDELRGSEPGVTIQPQTSQAETAQTQPESTTSPLSSDSGAGFDTAATDLGTAIDQSAEPAGTDVVRPDPVVTGAAGPTDIDLGTDTVGIGSQKAIFYTQGVDDTPGEASEGQVIWSRVEQPDGLPAIQGRIGIANPKIDVIITISKNSDQTLPASHLIEITFDGVQNISDTAIDRIPALVLKPNEQARGLPLVGAGVPVTESIFWIALSDKSEQVTTNLTTLRDGSWFDMPLLFKNEKRALITFEKGGAGEALFKEVLSAWEAS